MEETDDDFDNDKEEEIGEIDGIEVHDNEGDAKKNNIAKENDASKEIEDDNTDRGKSQAHLAANACRKKIDELTSDLSSTVKFKIKKKILHEFLIRYFFFLYSNSRFKSSKSR